MKFTALVSGTYRINSIEGATLLEIKCHDNCQCCHDNLNNVGQWIHQMNMKNQRLVEVLKKIANEDFRGNRPQSAVDAYNVLKELGYIND